MKDTGSSDYIPLRKSLEEIYDNSTGQVAKIHLPRYQAIAKKFEEVYGEKPDFFSRAPGRVNIIGEHIDYCGYAVLPAAIEQDMIIAFKESKELEIEVHNMNEKDFKHLKFPLDKDVKFMDTKEDKWVNYFLAAFRHIAQRKAPILNKGYKVLISSTVPIDSGLSSSAAFSVSSTLVPLTVYGLREKYTRSEMVQHIIDYERSVGVACGGMDQTISVFAEAGTAKLIEFNPIKAYTVNIPKKAALVISNSLTVVPKLLTAGTRYNKRVVECRVGLVLLCMKLGLIKAPTERPFATFYELQKHLGYTFPQMVELVEKHVKKEPYTEEDIKTSLGCEFKEVVKDIPNHDIVLSSNKEYFIHNRAYHVFTEAERVYKFKEVCEKEEHPNQLEDLGRLMNESHASCRDLYDCSSAELEILTKMCRDAGAYGSRLTGAGWGGCAISLVPFDKVQDFLKAIEPYYKTGKLAQELNPKDIPLYLFASKPGSGATVLDAKSVY